MSSSEIEETGRSAGVYRGHALSSAFQPIFSPAHHRAVGFEALVRVEGPQGTAVSPPALFDLAAGFDETRELDRQCRRMHLANFPGLAAEPSWLFLNVSPQAAADARGESFPVTAGLARDAGVAPERIVIEILESAIPDQGLMTEIVGRYRDMGFLVAIDDFGAGHSNFDRIWRLEPDIVKLDRSLIAEAAASVRARRVLPGLVRLVHEAGCLVLLEGIETREEALIGLDCDADFVQGYLFGRPETRPERLVREFPDPHAGDGIQARHRGREEEVVAQVARRVRHFLTLAREAERLGAGLAGLLEDPGVRRCFVLDHAGIQVGPNLTRPGSKAAWRDDRRFAPIAEAKGADWSRRTYFRRARHRPGEVQISGPYLSLPDAEMCVTLSVALGERIYCCDLLWDGEASAEMVLGSAGVAGMAGG